MKEKHYGIEPRWGRTWSPTHQCVNQYNTGHRGTGGLMGDHIPCCQFQCKKVERKETKNPKSDRLDLRAVLSRRLHADWILLRTGTEQRRPLK